MRPTTRYRDCALASRTSVGVVIMSSVTTAIVADIKRQFGAGVDQLRAKHDDELKADISRLREDLESQLSRVTGLAAKVVKPAAVPVAKTAPVVAPQIKTTKPKAKKSSKGVIRFRDPANPEKTWTGRGTQPGWYKAGIAAGKTREHFAIPGA